MMVSLLALAFLFVYFGTLLCVYVGFIEDKFTYKKPFDPMLVELRNHVCLVIMMILILPWILYQMLPYTPENVILTRKDHQLAAYLAAEKDGFSKSTEHYWYEVENADYFRKRVKINNMAYFIWEKEGRPEGRDLEFWVKAERMTNE